MQTLTKLIGLIALALVTTLVMSWASDTLWVWFVNTSGPGMKGWFAIFTIVSIAFQQNTTQLAKATLEKGESIYKRALSNHIALILGALATVGLSWLTGQVIGWL